MTSMQSNQVDSHTTAPEQHDSALFGMEATSSMIHQPGFGSQLRAAREARSLDIETCAHALKLSARILRKLEQDDHEGIDSKIYLASYIGKYGQYLEIDDAAIQAEIGRIRQVEPALVVTGGISHSRFLFDRYVTAATYVVLTLVIAVPTIWFGVRSTMDRDLSHLTPLDATPVAQQDAPAPAASTAASVATHAVANTPATASTPAPAASVPSQPAQEQPLMASMAPFPNIGNDTLPTPSKLSTPAAGDTGSGAHSLSLTLSAASWVEVTEQDGTKLEYGLLPAGSSKTYHSDQPLTVRIGNVSGAQVSIDGQSVSLDDFRHANVARFRMQVQDGKASAANL